MDMQLTGRRLEPRLNCMHPRPDGMLVFSNQANSWNERFEFGSNQWLVSPGHLQVVDDALGGSPQFEDHAGYALKLPTGTRSKCPG